MWCEYIRSFELSKVFFHFHIEKIFLTHGHHDHCSGIAKLLSSIGEIPVYMSQNDFNLFKGVVEEGKTIGLNVRTGRLVEV